MINERIQRLKYIAADFFSAAIAIFVFNIVRYHLLEQTYESFSATGFLSSPSVVLSQIFFPPAMLVIDYLSGYYNSVYLKSRMHEFVTTIVCSFIGALLVFFVALIDDMTPNRSTDYELVFAMFAVLFLVSYTLRLTITNRTARRIRSGKIFFNTLIAGYSSHPEIFENSLRKIRRSSGKKIVGFIDIENHPELLEGKLSLPIFAQKDIERVCHDMDVRNIIVTPHPTDWRRTMLEISSLLTLDCSIFISPDDLHILSMRSQQIDITSEPLIDISRSDMSQSSVSIKRFTDIILSSLTLIVTALPMAVACLLIRLDSPGSPIFRQQRIGYHKRPFYIYKLRTMYVDAEEQSGPQLSHDGDKRITRVGRILRKFRFDEFPQFWNVLRGDMSIVGPRPEREYFIRQILQRAPQYALLHQIRPGITSWGMVKYGYASTVDQMVERLRYDILYLENMSLLVDMKIIFYTAHTVVTGKGI